MAWYDVLLPLLMTTCGWGGCGDLGALVEVVDNPIVPLGDEDIFESTEMSCGESDSGWALDLRGGFRSLLADDDVLWPPSFGVTAFVADFRC